MIYGCMESANARRFLLPEIRLCRTNKTSQRTRGVRLQVGVELSRFEVGCLEFALSCC